MKHSEQRQGSAEPQTTTRKAMIASSSRPMNSTSRTPPDSRLPMREAGAAKVALRLRLSCWCCLRHSPSSNHSSLSSSLSSSSSSSSHRRSSSPMWTPRCELPLVSPISLASSDSATKTPSRSTAQAETDSVYKYNIEYASWPRTSPFGTTFGMDIVGKRRQSCHLGSAL
eukprot:5896807-Prymnesium_polylepis.1